MVPKFTLFGNLLLASAALAIPSSQPEAFLARRREKLQSGAIQRSELTAGAASMLVDDTIYEAGVSLDGSYGGIFNFVTGTVTVPSIEAESGSTVAVVFSIDGRKCPGASLHGGVECNGGSEPKCVAVIGWDPDFPYVAFNNFTVNPGENVSVTLRNIFMGNGSAFITKESTGETVGKNFSSISPLCGATAAWTLQVFGNVTKASNVTFTNAVASGPNGVWYTPPDTSYNATILKIMHGLVVFTNVDVTGGGLSVQYFT